MRQSFRTFVGVVSLWIAGFLLPLSMHAQPALFAGPTEVLGWVIGLGGDFLWRDGPSSAALLGAISFPLPFGEMTVASQSAISDGMKDPAAGRSLRFGPVPAEAHERVYESPVQSPLAGSQPGALEKFWNAFRLYVFGIFAVSGLTFAEWRWMIARQNELRALVKERTRELEAEKAELLETKAALVQLAAHDPLTGLFNRAAIFEILEHEAELARRDRRSFAVVLADLDHFKRVNDTYGHLIGDEVLREFARRTIANLRPCDNAGRFGGEELLMLLPGLKEESIERVRELHRRVSQEPVVFNGLVLRVTCSFGVAWFPGPLNTVESLLDLADQALYAAKANGRNRVEVAGRLYIPRLGNGGSSRRLSL